jgi:hypothetical protein
MRPKRERADDATAEARGRIEIRPSSIRLLRLSKVEVEHGCLISRRQFDRTRIDDARFVFLSSSSRGFGPDLCGADATLLQF